MPKLSYRRNPTVLVAGAFRSGTNATKACIENFFKVDVVFNRWFWKHGLAPSFTHHPLPANVCVLLLCRHPESWAPSIHRFWQERRPELDVSDSLSLFLRSPFIVYDTTGNERRPHYWFSSPLDYWTRYYYSWLNWGEVSGQLRIVQFEDLTADTDSCLSRISEETGWHRRRLGPLKLPTNRVGPEVRLPTADEQSLLQVSDRDFIRKQLNPDVFNGLGYAH